MPKRKRANAKPSAEQNKKAKHANDTTNEEKPNSSWSVFKLKGELRKQGLSTAGNKSVLLQRLGVDINSNAEHISTNSNKNANSKAEKEELTSNEDKANSNNNDSNSEASSNKNNTKEKQEKEEEESVNDEEEDSDDELGLNQLFSGGGEAWIKVLKPIIKKLPNAKEFIGKARKSTIVPLREMTFQALKPLPPNKWKVVIFGQSPYKRVESATGIAWFDNRFSDWNSGYFGKTTSMRCLIKAALMWKYNIAKKTSTDELRKLLSKHKVVSPAEWFQAMLTQGLLLMSAALTISTDNSITTTTHKNFWKPVITKIIEHILYCKQNSTNDEDKSIVFAWWGVQAKSLEPIAMDLINSNRFNDVTIKHVYYHDPAARFDKFCDEVHFTDLNNAIEQLNMQPIEFLPTVGWDEQLRKERRNRRKNNKTNSNNKNNDDDDDDSSDDDDDDDEHNKRSKKMANFITTTMNLHKMYLDRISGVKYEISNLPEISGISSLELLSFADIVNSLPSHINANYDAAIKFATNKSSPSSSSSSSSSSSTSNGSNLSMDEIAALHLYTMGSNFYKKLNAALRDSNRNNCKEYFHYLRLFLSAFEKLPSTATTLWRGVNLDLKHQYPLGETITWWGVSSCTKKKSVAMDFLEGSSSSTLFLIRSSSAKSVMLYSQYFAEAELILAPGTQLKVEHVESSRKLTTITLEELADKRLVS